MEAMSMNQRDGLGVLYIQLHLVEIREVAPQYTDSKAISTENAKNPADASTTDRGKTQAKTPTTSESSKYSSVLSKIL